MGRPKTLRTSADYDAEIARLKTQRLQTIAAEDRRRGELLANYLAGEHGPRLREALKPAVADDDRFLFGL